MYRVGIVGGGFGVRGHLPAFAAHPQFEVVAIASPHSAKAVAKERKIPHAFENCEAMLGGCELDVVSIASPPFTHHPDVLASISAGKHVICEKPFALSVAQAQEMLAAAQKAKTATAVMHEFRWVPQRFALKELIANGHLSPLRELEITHLARMLRLENKRKNTWWFDRSKGGGIAGALLSHIIDSANWMAGRAPVRSTGYLRTANPRREGPDRPFEISVDDGAFGLIDYGEGVVARVTVDGTTAVDALTVAAHGEDRSAVASGSGLHAMRLFSVDEEETSELECKPSPNARFGAVDPHVPPIMDLLDEFVKEIETGESIVPTFAEAVETQKVLASVGFGS
ncbi:MAG TPA: Gfo/Idh/MocA family oxidoreductase [Candidatus Rubrimentiphilum sp.]|nr:Gfo/Idh/MocA family oxidoreductase [Candidatus Rubrimentiphilum sp.]